MYSFLRCRYRYSFWLNSAGKQGSIAFFTPFVYYSNGRASVWKTSAGISSSSALVVFQPFILWLKFKSAFSLPLIIGSGIFRSSFVLLNVWSNNCPSKHLPHVLSPFDSECASSIWTDFERPDKSRLNYFGSEIRNRPSTARNSAW